MAAAAVERPGRTESEKEICPPTLTDQASGAARGIGGSNRLIREETRRALARAYGRGSIEDDARTKCKAWSGYQAKRESGDPTQGSW